MTFFERTCNKCGFTGELENFVAQKGYKHDRRPTCYPCWNKYARETAYPRAKTKDWYKESHKKAVKKYSLSNETKYRAQYTANNHNRYKRLRDKVCEMCKVGGNLHMHHPDYSKPLKVVTLCVTCHESVHHKGAII